MLKVNDLDLQEEAGVDAGRDPRWAAVAIQCRIIYYNTWLQQQQRLRQQRRLLQRVPPPSLLCA